MIIHLIGSLRQFDEDLLVMRTIIKTVEKSNNSIALRWVEGVHDRKIRNSAPETTLDWGEIVDENIDALTHADAIIVEGSHFNYSQGYQTALALQQNKPVLNLYREDLPEYKEWPDKFFVSGISHPFFTSKAYKDEKDLEKIVTKFLKDHEKKKRELDVKIVLDSDVYAKIDKLSQETNKSKASVVKDLLSRQVK